MTVLDWLSRPAGDRGLRLLGPDGDFGFHSYTDLARSVHRVSARLRALGARPGDVVSLIQADPLTFIASFWGVLAAGMVPSPLATPLSFGRDERYLAQLGAILPVAEPAVILTDDVLGELVAAARTSAVRPPVVLRLDLTQLADGGDPSITPVGPEQPALLQFTSGSTGTPKGVRISRRAFDANVSAIRDWLGWREDDVGASWLPLYHDMGLIGGMVTPIVSGADLFLMTPAQFIRSPLTWLECLGRHGATITTSPSFGYGYAARRVRPAELTGLDFSAWRVAILGAERIEPAALAAFCRLTGPQGFDPAALVGAYGLAEVTLAACGTAPGQGARLVRAESTVLPIGEPVVPAGTGRLGLDEVQGVGWMTACGTPLAGLRVTIVDDEGAPVADGTFGEIQVAGTGLADGYLLADGTRQDFDPAGLRTGDSGFVLDGELYVVGRLGESMKVRGASLHAEDLELELAGLEGLPRVRCAVAFGRLEDAHLAVVFVGREVDDAWVKTATDRIRTLTAGTARALVLVGGPGAITQTSSGKPRRRTMWTELLSGEAGRWTVRYGELPVPVAVPAGEVL
jgi:acyl-CoA synthetase (AMP-forming)/AMP-acid ligase II